MSASRQDIFIEEKFAEILKDSGFLVWPNSFQQKSTLLMVV